MYATTQNTPPGHQTTHHTTHQTTASITPPASDKTQNTPPANVILLTTAPTDTDALPRLSDAANPATHATATPSGNISGMSPRNANMDRVNASAAAMPARLSTESDDDRWSQMTDTTKKGASSHQGGDHSQARHRASRAGTRCVSKLSAAQLTRKRANDREAQRAIRQRTKEHIENLERRIVELSDPSKELKMVWEIQQRNRELEEEIDALKERVARMQMQNAAVNNTAAMGMPMGMPQSMPPDMASMPWPMESAYHTTEGMGAFGGQPMRMSKESTPASGTDITSYPASDGLLSPFPGSESPAAGGFPDLDAGAVDFGPSMAGHGPPDNLGLASDLATQRAWNSQSPFDIKEQNMFSPPPNTYAQPGGLPFAYSAAPTTQAAAPTSAPGNLPYNMAQQARAQLQTQHPQLQSQLQPQHPQPQLQPQHPQPQPQPQHPQLQSQPHHLQLQSQPEHSPQHFPQQLQPAPSPSLPAWARTPRFLPPTSLIDSLLQSALHDHRTSVISGAPNPPQPDYTSLITPSSGPPSTLSGTISHAIRLAGVATLASQAGALYLTHTLLRWQTNPLPDTYANVPAWLRPGPRQLEVPHPLWASQLMWPALRDRVVCDPERYGMEEFAVCYARGLEVEWEGEGRGEGDGFESGVLELRSGGEVVLARAFEEKVRELGSWRVGGGFVGMWPELAGTVRSLDE